MQRTTFHTTSQKRMNSVYLIEFLLLNVSSFQTLFITQVRIEVV